MELKNKFNNEDMEPKKKKWRYIPIRGMGTICEEWIIMPYRNLEELDLKKKQR